MKPRNRRRQFIEELVKLRARDKNAARFCQDETAARKQLEDERWPNGPLCPFNRQHSAQRVKPFKGKSMGAGWYHCRLCRRIFTVRVNTILHRSHIPLHKWLVARELYRYTRRSNANPPTVIELAQAMEITFRAAQFVEKRMRAASTTGLDFFTTPPYKPPDEQHATRSPRQEETRRHGAPKVG